MKFRPWYRFEAFDLQSGTTPVELESLYESAVGDLGVVVLLAGPEARTRGWAGRAAVRIAERLTARGHDVRLLDVSVADPVLHLVVDTSNEEGVSDLVLFGASTRRLERRVRGDTLSLIPAGPPVADAANVLGSTHWDTLIRRFRADSRAHLVFVPAEVEGAMSLAALAGTAIVLAAGTEAHAIASAVPRDCALAAALHPAGDVAVAPAEADLRLPDWEPVRRPATPADLASDGDVREPAVAGSSAKAGTRRDGGRMEAPLTEPYVSRPARRGVEITPLRLVLGLILLFLLGWLAWDTFGGNVRETGNETSAAPGQLAAAQPSSPPATVDMPAGEPIETGLDYAVAIEAYTDLGIALRRVAALREEEPGVGFLSSPTLVRGVVYHRVMAGPVVDRGSGSVLMQRLVEAGHKTSADDWAVRSTPWTYLLVELADSAAAEARAGAFRGDSVPTYVVEQPYTSGGRTYRLYYGAFESREEAESFGTLIAEQEIDARLVDRSGNPDA